ncbi:hypothetical protein [Chryseobacterium sp. GVT01B]|uniref:hypothetical protein n=1 Tax=Chryseobacterium sp. GVT01B TaxID=2862675 RepID=UPI001CC06CF5|nr:hypothetical protein [Chryseobacterium sp. GVT01B]
MKRTIVSLAILIAGMGQLYAQQQQVNFGDSSRPVPSVSSLATYTNTPISNATGIPDTSFPLLGLPTYNNETSLNVGLSYNPMNVSESEPASQVGRGWSLFAGGVISRSIENDIDEMLDNSNSNNYYQNEFDDTYYYNLPGISGKFRFKRNTTNNTFELVNLSSNKIKIEYTRSSNTATMILESFTITDIRGIKYIFNDYSRSNQERNVFLSGGKVYKSAFFLTQIKDANNSELASFSYQKDTKYKNNGVIISYQTCKLKTITSPGFGKIEFEYLYNPALENSMNDPYQVQKIILKDNYNHMVSGYSFEYSSFDERTLSKLEKLNKNNVVSETTVFEYGNASTSIPIPYGTDPNSICPGLSTGTPIVGTRGILKRINTPSGGVVEYNFEQNIIFKDRTNPAYLNEILNPYMISDPEVQYLNPFWGAEFDTHVSNNTNYTLTITGNPGTYKRVFVMFIAGELYTDNPMWDPTIPYSMGYSIKSGGVVVTGNPCQSPSSNGNYYATEYSLLPGTYSVQVGGSGGQGAVQAFEIAHIPQPFHNTTRAAGARIANIKYYNSTTDTTPVKTTKFEYNSFTDSNTSSGYSVFPDGDINASNFIIYKNVKITNADDTNGYTQYYYKIPNDFPKEPYTVNGSSVKIWPQYNLISSGLLDKKELYNAQAKLLASEQTTYTFDNIPGTEEYGLGNWAQGIVYTKLGWLKKIVNTSKTYFDNNQSIEEQSETNFNVFNFDLASTKKVVDGNTIEQFYTYPETGYANLSNAHIMNVPVLVEEKNGGKTVSKAETKYDNTGSTFPTSVVATNISDGTTKTAMKFDLYDEKGNLLQFTSSVGIPTAIVYGYDKTQPIAKIEGATYAQVSPYIQAIVDASTADAQNPDNEGTLLTALDNFRKTAALKDFQITTITYDPLIGMTTTTAPDGIRAIYKYDANNRLQKIVDMNGVTLKEYQYNYKN